jgi:6-hydroxy-3-succinoylpyridine 3-monooxygenase
MERVAVFIDGANFYYGLKSINPKYNDFHFDFEKFFQTITKNRKFVGAWYYTAPIKGDRSLNLEQQKLISRLTKASCLVRICRRQRVATAKKLDMNCLEDMLDEANNKKYQNKMDDVWLAVDMVNESRNNIFDIAVLISGDGDIEPAVNMIRKEHTKKTLLYGFDRRTSPDLITACGNFQLIDKKAVRRHFYHASNA